MDKKHVEIIKKIISNGHEAYFVGGYIRDIFSGLQPTDCDIVTNAPPTKLVHIFSGENIDLVGKSFLVTIINGIEISTFRSERYTGFSGKPEVQRAITLEDDLSRRDLTINAIALDINGKLIDPFGGKEDLLNKVIRFVGDPKKRIKEDPCRIIRALRFCSLFGDKYHIEYNTKKALKKYSHMVVKYVPVERIRLEIIKCLNYKNPSIFFRLLEDFNLLKYILPSLHKCVNVCGGSYHAEKIFDHNLMCGDSLPKTKPLLRLAGYLHDIGKPDAFNSKSFRDHATVGRVLAESDLTRLRFSSEEILYVANLIGSHMKFITGMKNSTLRRFVANLRGDKISWKDLIMLKIADRNANLAKSNFTRKGVKQIVFIFYNALKVNKIFSVNNLKIDGNDLMTFLNMKEGKEIGDMLKFVFDKVMDNPKLNSNKFVLLDLIAKKT